MDRNVIICETELYLKMKSYFINNLDRNRTE